MAAAQPSRLMSRLNGVLGLLIGVFGAMAILGVFFKIAKYPGVDYELFMAIGFMGEAAAFIIMGLFALISGFTAKPTAPASDRTVSAYGATLSDEMAEEFRAALMATAAEFQDALQASSSSFGAAMQTASGEFRASVRDALDERIGHDLGAMMNAVGEDVRHFGGEMRGLGDEMKEARTAVHAMRQALDRVATGSLPEDAERLGTGMRQLGEGMEEAGSAVDRMRNDLNEMAARFSAFNRSSGMNGNVAGKAAVGVSVAASKRDHAEVA